MPSLDVVRRRLESHEPRLLDTAGRMRAAVALVLRPRPPERRGPGFDVLLIERAERAGDPWSGHMAFPGGRVERDDRDARAAAERETLEEVGVRLDRAEHLGRLDDLQGRADRPLPLVISAFVYSAPDTGPLETNYEVREALWVPARRLVDPAHHIDYVYARNGGTYPGIRVSESDRHVVWGLTYRFLGGFFELIGAAQG